MQTGTAMVREHTTRRPKDRPPQMCTTPGNLRRNRKQPRQPIQQPAFSQTQRERIDGSQSRPHHWLHPGCLPALLAHQHCVRWNAVHLFPSSCDPDHHHGFYSSRAFSLLPSFGCADKLPCCTPMPASFICTEPRPPFETQRINSRPIVDAGQHAACIHAVASKLSTCTPEFPKFDPDIFQGNGPALVE